MSRKKFLPKEAVLQAMKQTKSNRSAARYLHVSFVHYKKYAKLYVDQETGKTLWELHKNESGRGIPKTLRSGKHKYPPLQKLIDGILPVEYFNPKTIKIQLIQENYLEECCNMCGFRERRVIDLKVPLILHHKDRNKKNYNLSNLELLCYNCSFLFAVSPITTQQVEVVEDYLDRKKVEPIDWELDKDYIEHLRNLDLYEEPSEDMSGKEFITKLQNYKSI